MRAEIGGAAGSCPLAVHAKNSQSTVPAITNHLRFKLFNRVSLVFFIGAVDAHSITILKSIYRHMRFDPDFPRNLRDPDQKNEK
jgi:hypothetical protein